MVCKICGKEVHYKSMKKHIQVHHIDIFLYGYKYSVFYTEIMKEKVYLENFDNICKKCGSSFIMVMDQNGEVKIKNCTQCANHTLQRKLETLIEDTNIRQQFINKYLTNLKDTGASYNNYIQKYGEREGKKRYNNWINKTKGTLKSYILRHGKEEGTKRYNQFKKRSANTKERFIERHGEKEGIKRYNQNKEAHQKNTPLSLNYWLKKVKGDYYEAQKLLYNFQRRDLSFFITKYGEKEGLDRFNKMNKRKSKNSTYNYYIKTYGKKEGHQLFLSKLLKTNGRKSKISIEFQKLLEVKLKYSIETEKQILIEKQLRTFFVDFYIPEKNVIIEFYGDYWHANPLFYNNTDMIKSRQASEIWREDENRIQSIKEYTKCSIIIVWESDYKKNKFNVIENIVNILENKNERI